MKDFLGRELLEVIPAELVFVVVALVLATIVFMDRDEFRNWSDVRLTSKLFNIVTVIALLVVLAVLFLRIL